MSGGLTEDIRSPEYWLINTYFYKKIKIPLKIITKTDKNLPLPTTIQIHYYIWCVAGDITFSTGIFFCIMDI